MAKPINKQLTLSGSPGDLVFHATDFAEILINSQRRHQIHVGMEKSEFLTNISLCLGNDTRWIHSYTMEL